MVGGKVGVDQGGLDDGVAHELLDGRQVHAFHDQVAGESMAEGVDFSEVLYTRFFGYLDKFLTELGFELTAVFIGKDEIAFLFTIYLFTIYLFPVCQLTFALFPIVGLLQVF